MAIDPDVAQLLTEVNARLTALEARPEATVESFKIVSHTVVLEGGEVLTYNLVG